MILCHCNQQGGQVSDWEKPDIFPYKANACRTEDKTSKRRTCPPFAGLLVTLALYPVSQKCPPFNFFLNNCQNLTDFNNFCYAKSWENLTWQICPSHLSGVATLPWEVKKIIFFNYNTWNTHCLMFPIVCIALVLHLGHATGGARVLI